MKSFPKIKICGLTRECDIKYVNELSPDYIGFVFAKSKRQISIEKAKILKGLTNDNINVVGVFVNEEIEKIIDIVNSNIIDTIQLHGSENDNYIKLLREYTNKKIIKAFNIRTFHDLIKANQSSADYVLLDNGTGGTGEKFDWEIINTINKEFFLAGGINQNNIKKAIKFNPFAIDVSSGVEVNGYKDYKKMCKIIELLRE